MIKQCAHCGAPFHVAADEHWKTLCLSCWKRSKRTAAPLPAWTPADTKVVLLTMEVEELTAANAALRAKLDEAQAELNPDMLRLLVHLTHPDRHGGSPAATKATVFLNNLRQRITAHD